MNAKQLQKLGVPPDCVKAAIQALGRAAGQGTGMGFKGKRARQLVAAIVQDPRAHETDPVWGELARELLAADASLAREAISYRTWGDDIDTGAHEQMRAACQVPNAVAAALMPDAHIGYGLPIGGVLACDNAVIPYAVGVDIACRMKLSVLDLPVASLDSDFNRYKEALMGGTRFGVGVEHRPAQSHAVMDRDWSVSRITRERKDTAWKQLGTSGSGNHFVEFGVMTLPQNEPQLGLAAGEYVALLSHSGSRGAGAAVCSTYSQTAQQQLPKRYKNLGRLAWLSLDSEAGQEYWSAMNLMGEYASANHAVIHRLVTKLLGAEIIAGVENHHNFAWKERHQGRELFVHRKGNARRGRRIGRDPRHDGRPGIRRPWSRQSAQPQLGRPRRRPPHVAQEGQRHLPLPSGAERPRTTRHPRARRRLRRSPRRLQGHSPGDGRPGRPGRNDRPLRPQNRPHVRRRQPRGRLTRDFAARADYAISVGRQIYSPWRGRINVLTRITSNGAHP
jgi:tRNA-splicing ligase RtcB